MKYDVIPITNVSQIESAEFMVWNQSNSYLPLDDVMRQIGADHVYEIEHQYGSRITKTYYIPIKGHNGQKHIT